MSVSPSCPCLSWSSQELQGHLLKRHLNIKSVQLILSYFLFNLAAQRNWSRGHFDSTEIIQGNRRRHFTHSFGRAERSSRRTSRDPANRPVRHASIRPSTSLPSHSLMLPAQNRRSCIHQGHPIRPCQVWTPRCLDTERWHRGSPHANRFSRHTPGRVEDALRGQRVLYCHCTEGCCSVAP